MSKTASVSVTRTFAATPERAFGAWLSRESVAQWLFRTPLGE